MAISLRDPRQAKKALSFKKYCKFISECAKKHNKGWEIEIDPIAKYEGELMISYRYIIYKKNGVGEMFYFPALPPIFVSNYHRGMDIADDRFQMTKKEVFIWLDKLEEDFNKYVR